MDNKPNFEQLLKDAVNKPGIMLEAYRAFHRYSSANQMLAYTQCTMRGIQPGPLSTFKTWKDKGRSVKKGQKAISLWMPTIIKKEKENDKGEKEEESFAFFKYVPRWFVYSQTEGEEFKPDPIPGWDKEKALKALDITEDAFTDIRGNVQGYARQKSIAVNPMAQLPHKTRFHEIAHILLGHTFIDPLAAFMIDDPSTSVNLMEAEAESVAMLCCASLNLPGIEYCRGYIQNWYGQNEIPEKSARKIFSVADKILKAGQI